jgi:hypothetical protein
MYPRTIQRHNKDGSTVRYVQLAHNHRKGTSTQAEVLVQLGREDRLDMEGLRRLVGSISRYLDGAGALPPGGPEAALQAESPASSGRCGYCGAVAAAGGRRCPGWGAGRTPVHHGGGAGAGRLVANRAVDSMSKLSAAEWVGQDAAIPGLAGMDEDHTYRAMDLLVATDAEARVQEAVFFAAANLLNLEVDLLLFDTALSF